MAGPWEDAPTTTTAAGEWEDAPTTPAAKPSAASAPVAKPAPEPEPIVGHGLADPTFGGAPVADPATVKSFLRGMADPIHGGAQLLAKVTPAPVESVVNRLNNWLAEKTGLLTPVPPGGVDELIRQREAKIEAERGPNAGTDWVRSAGNLASPATYVGGAGSTLARAALSGAVSSALQPETGKPEDYWRNKGKEALLGGVTGVGGMKAAQSLGNLLAPNLRKEAQILLSEGVPLTPGQMIGGLAHRAEDALSSVPAAGSFIKSGQQESLEGFNKAVINRGLKEIGEKVPAGVAAGHDALAFAHDAFDAKYDKLLPTMQGAMDTQLASDLSSIEANIANLGLPAENERMLRHILDHQIRKPLSTGETVSGDAYKGIESTLSAEMRRLDKGDYFDRLVGRQLNEVKDALHDMLARSNPPEKVAELAKIDKGYANFLIAQNAVNLGKNGVFTVDQLSRAVTSFDSSKNKSLAAQGRALMQDLGRAGRSVLPRTVADSGTAERLFWRALAGAALGESTHVPGASVIAPALATTALVAAPYSPFGLAAMRKWAQPAPWRQLAARPFSDAQPYISPAFAAMLRTYRPQTPPPADMRGNVPVTP